MTKKLFILFFLLSASAAFAQTSLNSIRRGTFPVRVQQEESEEEREARNNKRQPNTMDANGQYIGPVLIPVVIDGQVVLVPKDKALVLTPSTKEDTTQYSAPGAYGGTTITMRRFRDNPNPKIKNWPAEFLGMDKPENTLSGLGSVVAIFDSGVNAHEQFSNGNVDVLDVMDKNNPNDEYGHGTAVAGIIGGSMEGESGFRSIAPQSRIKSYKIADEEGRTNNLYIVKAVEKVLEYNALHPDNKINIINISYGLDEDDNYLKTNLKKAYDSGITIIASAGNNGNNVLVYPAAYDFVIAVAAVNHRGMFVSTSSRGAGVDFVAPGAAIFAPGNANDYVWVKGTSFATAYITGIAALITEAWKAKYGGKPSPQQLRAVLEKISTPLPQIEAALQGSGSPDASKILSSI